MSTRIINGDAGVVLRELPEKSINCCVTSPPYYGLRDYGMADQIGLEGSPQEYIEKLVHVFREVKRVLRDDGTLWLNIGDSYAANRTNNGGYSAKSTLQGFTNANTKGRIANDAVKPRIVAHGVKEKDLIGVPWMLAFALRADGWYLRQDIIWHKPNPMPESVRDRCTKAHEYIFLFSKSPKYYFNNDAIKEPCKKNWRTRNRTNGKYPVEDTGLQPHSGLEKSYEFANKRSVWSVTTKPFKGAHFATFPVDLITPCILAGCPVDGTVLDPFGGSGTVGIAANDNGRDAVLVELNPAYVDIAQARINEADLLGS